MRSALALRTSIVTAALAGAMLIPAAGSAFAAPVTAAPVTAAAAAPQTAAAADNDRYEGEVHPIGQGMVAVLRNKAEEGPEAWIRYVGYEWKPGDNYMVSVVSKLDRNKLSDKIGDVRLELTEAESAKPVLVVTRAGVAKSYPLPAGKPASYCRVGPKDEALGAGVRADLYMGEYGPEAYLFNSGDDRGFALLDRATPSLPDSAGIIVRIVNPSGAAPVLEWKTQGGSDALGRASFPVLPKDCKAKYEVADSKPVEKPVAKPTPKPTPTTAQPKAQTAGQTTVVPKGSVAAGAEIAAEDGDDTTTAAAGAGLVAIFAGLGTALMVRARRNRDHG